MLLATLAVVACIADTVGWSPTPTYTWQIGPCDVSVCEPPVGSRVCWRHDDSLVRACFDLPFESGVDEDGIPWSYRPGVDGAYPVQRRIPGEAVLIDLDVRFYDDDGQEGTASNEVQLCLPEIWQPGEVYR